MNETPEGREICEYCDVVMETGACLSHPLTPKCPNCACSGCEQEAEGF
ncbi:hypothetical protein Nocox_36855 [Nonomuraea coxensis DSM 45129]|uniref:Rubrerythrin-like domain-containing protein n=1 Tax=Nonomuraea coxensis DSM 45129 TaxID=1122611 RepID=A0ABX8UBJ6_9ACTN|nr:hypothetical protein [Nonomuraea coxensis]QYC44925.1 hypothetical protein Nocox_36855 [Nonomuraea coxensis DSM 45129]